MSIFHDKAIKSVAEAAAKVMQQEELKGNQHKIDANKNGKVDAHDFKLLRGKKDMKEESELEEASPFMKGVKRFMAGKKNPSDVRDSHLAKSTFSADPKVKEKESRRYDKVQSVLSKEEVEQLDEVGDTPAGRKALGSYVNKAIDDKSKDRSKGLRKATSRMYKDNFYGKKNEEVEMNEEDAYNKDRYAVKNGKATKDNPTHMGSPSYKDQPHHVWATSAEHAVKKSMKKEEVEQLDELSKDTLKKYIKKSTDQHFSNLPTKPHTPQRKKGRERAADRLYLPNTVPGYKKEEVELDEAHGSFPTVADAKKRMDAGKTATGSVTKTKTGLVHKRDYKDDDNDSDDMQKKAKGYGARQNYKRSTRVNEAASFTEMLELYNEHGLKVLAPIETEEMDIDGTTIEVIDGDKINGYVETTVEEEVTNDEFTKEYEDQKASFEGKKKQPKVAAGKTTGVKEMPESFQQIDERELSKDEAKKKEEYVKGMKKGLSGFKERYGERAKSVMYGAATNMAKKD